MLLVLPLLLISLTFTLAQNCTNSTTFYNCIDSKECVWCQIGNTIYPQSYCLKTEDQSKCSDGKIYAQSYPDNCRREADFCVALILILTLFGIFMGMIIAFSLEIYCSVGSRCLRKSVRYKMDYEDVN